MPLYRFCCTKCDNMFTKICVVGNYQNVLCEQCQSLCIKMPSQINAPVINVTLDRYKNKKVMCNINKIMLDRSREYQKKYELGEMIEKHGLDVIKKNTGFFDAEGKLKKD